VVREEENGSGILALRGLRKKVESFRELGRISPKASKKL
jgi:hypothetical protein